MRHTDPTRVYTLDVEFVSVKRSVVFPTICGALYKNHMPARIAIHRAVAKTEQARQRVVNSRRPGNKREMGYTRLWERIRLAVLAQHPMCVFCMDKGMRTVATQVDHVDGCSKNNANDNLRPLCHSCHSRRTATDQSFGRRLPTSNK